MGNCISNKAPKEKKNKVTNENAPPADINDSEYQQIPSSVSNRDSLAGSILNLHNPKVRGAEGSENLKEISKNIYEAGDCPLNNDGQPQSVNDDSNDISKNQSVRSNTMKNSEVRRLSMFEQNHRFNERRSIIATIKNEKHPLKSSTENNIRSYAIPSNSFGNSFFLGGGMF